MISITRSTPEALPNPENAPDTGLKVKRNVEGFRDYTRDRIRAAAPEATAEEARKAADKAAEEAEKTEEQKKGEAAKGKTDQAPKPTPETTRASETTPEPKRNIIVRGISWTWNKLKQGTKLGAGLGAAGALSASGSSLASWPLLGKIPYLPQALGWLQGSITGVTNSLGIGTGPLATHSVLQTWPSWLWQIGGSTMPAWLGPALTGAVVIPGALWSIGKMKSLITGTEYSGFVQPIKEALKLPFQTAAAPFKLGYKGLLKLREGTVFTGKKIGDLGKGIVKYGVTEPLKFLNEKLVKGVIAPMLKPTGWGVGGAVAAGLLMGSNPGFLTAIGLGYLIPNLIKNKGWLIGGGGTGSSSPTGSHA